MNTKFHIDRIDNYLAQLSNEIKLKNAKNMQDINMVSEDFFKDLFNLIFEYQLINLNKLKQNCSGLDLGDEKNKIGIQVTSQKSKAKVNETIKKIIKYKLYEKYSHIIIFILDIKKTPFTTPPDTQDKFSIDIIDFIELSKRIQDKQNIVEQVSTILEKELGTKKNDESISNEVLAIIELIDYLSKQNCDIENIDTESIPNPEYKIKERFKDYSDFLIKEYKELCSFYVAIETAQKNINLNSVKIRKMASDLRLDSDLILTKHNGDPVSAMAEIVDNYDKIVKSKLSGYDKSAIRFFIIEQLCKCNVFPNK